MATAQNFFNSTPAPDPRLNPLAAGASGGLQGLSNYGDYQKQMALMQYQMQQKQLTDAMNAGIQNHQAGFGQGPAGSTPMQFAGQPAYWDPQGLSPAGQMDMAKAQLYQTMNENKTGQGSPEAVAAYHGGLELLKSMASNSIDPKTGQSNFDWKKGLTDLHDYVNDNYNKPDTQQEEQPQPWQPGMPKSEGQSTASAAQQMFSRATGSKSNATPRAQRNQDQVQGIIDGLKKKGTPPAKIKSLMQQAGHDPSKYDI